MIRIHLHEKLNGNGRKAHYDHKEVYKISIDNDGYITIYHRNENKDIYTYKIEDFRQISIYEEY